MLPCVMLLLCGNVEALQPQVTDLYELTVMTISKHFDDEVGAPIYFQTVRELITADTKTHLILRRETITERQTEVAVRIGDTIEIYILDKDGRQIGPKGVAHKRDSSAWMRASGMLELFDDTPVIAVGDAGPSKKPLYETVVGQQCRVMIYRDKYRKEIEVWRWEPCDPILRKVLGPLQQYKYTKVADERYMIWGYIVLDIKKKREKGSAPRGEGVERWE